MTGDFNSAASSAAAELAINYIDSFVRNSSDSIRSLHQRISPKFQNHLANTFSRINTVKVICAPDHPIKFDEIFVTPSFHDQEKTYRHNDLLVEILEGKNIVIRSHGGAGKTFYMRHLWKTIFEGEVSKIPVLVELRNLNTFSTTDLINYARTSCTEGGDFTETNFDTFCKHGAFVFLFDGFDEIDEARREDIERDILQLAEKYPDCGLVVTGRPDQRFDSWQMFSSYACEGLSFVQFRELMDKLPFDEDSKKSFIKVADKSFFEKHKEFLSNPLLATMMLMTFREHAEIPSKLSIFYDHCFTTMFSRHDATKGYKRSRKLDQLEFAQVFSRFCCQSYLKGDYVFSTTLLEAYLQRAIKASNLTINVEDLIIEITEKTSLMQLEGLSYHFVHRSFQEYFAAVGAVRYFSKGADRILERFAERRSDRSLRLAYELQPELVETEYFIRVFDEKLNIKSKAHRSHPYQILSLASNGLSCSLSLVDGTLWWNGLILNEHYNYFSAVSKVYLESEGPLSWFLGKMNTIVDVSTGTYKNLENIEQGVAVSIKCKFSKQHELDIVIENSELSKLQCDKLITELKPTIKSDLLAISKLFTRKFDEIHDQIDQMRARIAESDSWIDEELGN